MKTNPFFPFAESDQVQWFKNFADKLQVYATKYGITPDELADMVLCALFFAALVGDYGSVVAFKESWTAYKDGMKDSEAPREMPQLPAFTLPAAPAPGFVGRMSKIVKKIKGNPAYNAQDGTDMGIEGTVPQPAPGKVIKPPISLRFATAGMVEIVSKKDGHSGIEIQISTDGGVTWTLLTVSLTAHFIDNITAAPTPGKPQARAYRAIYRDGNNQVGQWSEMANIALV